MKYLLLPLQHHIFIKETDLWGAAEAVKPTAPKKSGPFKENYDTLAYAKPYQEENNA